VPIAKTRGCSCVLSIALAVACVPAGEQDVEALLARLRKGEEVRVGALVVEGGMETDVPPGTWLVDS